MGARIEGKARGAGLRVAVAVARFNELVTERLLAGAVSALTDCGVDPDAIDVVWVPGGYELPQAASWLAGQGRHDAVVCLGAVLRGETPHFDYVCGPAAAGISRVGLETGIPVAFGLLTCDTLEQALHRAGGKAGNKGGEAARAALEMVDLRRRIGEL